MDQCRPSLLAAHKHARALKGQLIKSERVLAETRERFFDERSRNALLEEELQKQLAFTSELEGRLQDERTQQMERERELRHARQALIEFDAHPLPNLPSSNIRHVVMVSRSVTPCDDDGIVNNADSSRSTVGGAPPGCQDRDSQHVGWDAIKQPRNPVGMSNRVSTITLKLSSPEVWTQTPRWLVSQFPHSLRAPPIKRGDLARSAAQLRQLLSASKGILHEDDKVVLEFTHDRQAASQSAMAFTLAVVNQSSHDLQQVQINPHEISSPACRFRIEAEPGSATPGLLRPQTRLHFRGELEVHDVFEKLPRVDFSYLLPDNLRCQAALLLPLAISRLLVPIKPSMKHFVELWNSPEFAHAEVAYTCSLRSSLQKTLSAFGCTRNLEFGGVFHHVLGTSESVQIITLASSYPRCNCGPVEVLVCVEVGGPTRGETSLCRVAVRPTSHAVNCALAQVFLLTLSEPT